MGNTQPIFTCSKSTKETPEKCVKSVMNCVKCVKKDVIGFVLISLL